MKVSSKFKIAGSILLIAGIIITILSFTAFKVCDNCGRGWEGHKEAFGEIYTPNVALLFLGIVGIFIGITLLAVGFKPEMTKTAAKLNSETLDHAGKDISDTLVKTVETVSPAIEKTADVVAPAIGKITSSINKTDKKGKLDEAKTLYENGDITKEEYEAMRKDILEIDN